MLPLYNQVSNLVFPIFFTKLKNVVRSYTVRYASIERNDIKLHVLELSQNRAIVDGQKSWFTAGWAVFVRNPSPGVVARNPTPSRAGPCARAPELCRLNIDVRTPA